MKSLHVSLVLVSTFVLTAGGCESPPVEQGKGTGGSSGSGPEAAPPCPAGQVVQDDGSCMPIGIQGCAAKFIDSDGICRPSMTKCADVPGTIPKFDEGCVPVGIPKADCAPEFWDAAAGLCRPTMDKCANKPGTFAVPSMGCVSIDGPSGCGDGTWGNIVDGPNVVYVDQNYAGATSDGSKAIPYKTISAAVSAAPNDGTVAIALGSYEENIVIDKPLAMEGRCASMVDIVGTTPNVAVIHVSSPNATLRNLTVGGAGIGLNLASNSTTLAERLHIDSATDAGINVDPRGNLTVRHSIVEHTRPGVSSFSGGAGLDSNEASKVTVEHSVLYANQYGGIMIVQKDAQCNVVDSLIEGTLPRESDGALGAGIVSSLFSSIDVKNTAVVRNHSEGLLICVYAHGKLTNSLVEGTQREVSINDFGVGVNVNTYATAEISNNAILENYASGIYVTDFGVASTRGNLMAHNVAPPDTRQGQGIFVWRSVVDSTDDVLYQNHSAGAFAFEASVFTAQRLLIEDTQPHPNTDQDGAGLGGYLNTRFDIENSAFLNNVVTGVGLAFGPVQVDPMSPAPEPSRIRNSLISHTKAGTTKQQDGTIQTDFGDGIVAVWGGDLDVERTIVEKNARAGLFYYKSTGSVAQCEARDNAVGINMSASEVDFDRANNSLYNPDGENVEIDGAMEMPPLMTGE